MFRRSLEGTRDQFFIAASLTLPRWKDSIWIAGALIDGSTRGNDLATATRTRTPARCATLDVDSKLQGYIFH